MRAANLFAEVKCYNGAEVRFGTRSQMFLFPLCIDVNNIRKIRRQSPLCYAMYLVLFHATRFGFYETIIRQYETLKSSSFCTIYELCH
jgi:hypothetical protein